MYRDRLKGSQPRLIGERVPARLSRLIAHVLGQCVLCAQFAYLPVALDVEPFVAAELYSQPPPKLSKGQSKGQSKCQSEGQGSSVRVKARLARSKSRVGSQ